MVDHAIKEVIAIFIRSPRYQEVELKASITSDWLSYEKDNMKPLSLQNKNRLKGDTVKRRAIFVSVLDVCKY